MGLLPIRNLLSGINISLLKNMKILKVIFVFCFLTAFVLMLSQCANDKKESIPEIVNTACYPDAVGKIFVEKCATSGCHNTTSKDAAAGLDLSSWDKLFNGSRGGSAVIPYSADQSFLVNFINTYSDLNSGISQLPTMPNNGTPLSRDEVQTVINWINDGAPDCNGKRLTDDRGQKKFYITNQGCDLVSVWDADRKVIMKYIKVGGDPNLIESPHKVAVSPDGKNWYVSFTGTNAKYFQKYRTSDDSLIGTVEIGFGSWNTFAFSPDSKWAYIPNYNSNDGRVAVVDCETMTMRNDNFLSATQNPFSPGFDCVKPHGSYISPDGQYLYLTMQEDNYIYKIDLTGPHPDGIAIHHFPVGSSKPHELVFSPDGTIYFVTCQGSNDVLIFRVSDDTFLKQINVGVDPVEMSFSHLKPYLFVTCMAGNAVSIINYQDTTLVKTINTLGDFYYPHGVLVDDAHNVCYIVNRNVDAAGGPPPHHTSICDPSKKNGYLLAIDLNTLEIISGFKPELSIDPYSIAITK
jgi:DNA-binding beta-propeller fold protein YncE